jgi:hypothetical protein
MTKIQITDRYEATGTPYPDKNSCEECDGMGCYPLQKATLNKEACKAPDGKLLILGQKEKNGKPCEEDGWIFVRCHYCNGTRKK